MTATRYFVALLAACYAYSGLAREKVDVETDGSIHDRKPLVRRVLSHSVDAAALVAKDSKESDSSGKKEVEVEVNANGESEVTANSETEVTTGSESEVAMTEYAEVLDTGAAEAVVAEAGETRTGFNIHRGKLNFRTVTVSADASGLGLYCEEEYKSGYSRPGSPRLKGLVVELDKKGPAEDAVSVFGDRIIKAADASDAMRQCGSFFSFGDYTWCNKAMPAESDYARLNVWGGKSCNVTGYTPMQLLETTGRRELNSGQYSGLSFGIEELDPWSELMSSMYFLHTRLYDCYVDSKLGPMTNDWHKNHDREHPCTETRCYTEPYEVNHVCVNSKQKVEHGRKFETLHDYLNGRGPLSTYVKMDVEGSEWGVLNDLLNNEEDIAKIRTLDMEVHMTMTGGEEQLSMEKKVSIMEGLAKKFAVTGSTIQLVAESVFSEFEKLRLTDPNHTKSAELPHTSAGLPLNQYCISFVNRAFL